MFSTAVSASSLPVVIADYGIGVSYGGVVGEGLNSPVKK